MKNISKEYADNLYKEITEKGRIISDTMTTPVIRTIKVTYQNADYYFMFYKKELSKIEQYYNGRCIENLVK